MLCDTCCGLSIIVRNHTLKLEIEKLFLPAWQFVAAKSELPNNGDFLTLELFGRPLLIRNSGGKFLAYENICSHRHCLPTDDSCGNQPTLKCQYHGWEFDDEGRTAKIPEAKCFRPWDRDNSRLNMFRVEACGDLLFVSFNPDVRSLRDWLNPFFEENERAFSSPMWKMTGVWEYDCKSNWKVPVENTLESYHVTALHPKFFGHVLPSEDNMQHVLEHRYTGLTFTATSTMEMHQARLNRWLGGEPTYKYLHRHIHPNTVLVSTDTINYALMYVPTSPTTVRIRMRFFVIRGTRRGLLLGAPVYAAYSAFAPDSIETMRFIAMKSIFAGLFGILATPPIAIVALCDKPRAESEAEPLAADDL